MVVDINNKGGMAEDKVDTAEDKEDTKLLAHLSPSMANTIFLFPCFVSHRILLSTESSSQYL